MNIVSCQLCRKPFVRVAGPVCPACMEQLDKDFITVRDYIDEHKHSNIKLISEETEVSEQHIMFLIKEGRLIIDNPAGDGGGILFCESCKKSINTGRLCAECTAKLKMSMGAKTASKAPAAAKPEQDLKKLGRIR